MFRKFVAELCGLAGTLAQEIEFCASGLAGADRDNIHYVWRVDGENSFDTFPRDDPADGEYLVNAVSFAGDDGAREGLNAFLVAFNDFTADVNNISHAEKGDVLLQRFALNNVQHIGLHFSTPQ